MSKSSKKKCARLRWQGKLMRAEAIECFKSISSIVSLAGKPDEAVFFVDTAGDDKCEFSELY